MDTQEKGTGIFLDVFRRADKNDDGAVSWDEFKAFFADGVLSESELKNLFAEIDSHNTNNIDTGELCTYFSQHLGPFKEVLGAVEDLNAAVSKALHKSAETYPTSPFVEQFLTRFLLRELSNQLHALQRPVDVASDALDEQALLANDPASPATQSGEPQASQEEPVYRRSQSAEAGYAAAGPVAGRFGRRARRNQTTTQTSWQLDAAGGVGGLSQQVNRLQQLLDRLETRVSLDGGVEETVDIKEEKMILLVHSRMKVNSEKVKDFKASLRNYIESTNENPACQHLCIRSYHDSSMFRTYEIWETEEAWKKHVGKEGYRSFQHGKVDLLEVPEEVGTMPIPASWWRRDE